MTISTPITSPAAMSYGSLVADVQNYLQRNDEFFINQIPEFIYEAEQILASAVKDLGQLAFATETGFTQSIRKPLGWRSTNSIKITDLSTGGIQILIEKSYRFCQQFDSEITTGYPQKLPLYYSDSNYNNYFVTPYDSGLAADWQIELTYYAYPTYLSEVNQTNYWTDYYPQALEYAALMQACLFVREDDRAQMYQQALQMVLGTLDTEDNNRINDSAYGLKAAIQKTPPQIP